MNIEIITPATSQLFKFYTHCFAYPYEEMNYEFLSGNDEINISSFFDNHIIYWIPMFCDRLNATASLSFYKEAAIGLKETILIYQQD